MAQNYAASIQGVCIRATRLSATGAPATGANASYVTPRFIRAAFTPEYEEGEEITEKNAAGGLCVSYKSPDTLKRVTIELAICEPDPELTEILAGGTLFVDNSATPQTVGYSAPTAGSVPNLNGCALEVWSYAITNGRRAAVRPYFHWLFPSVQLRPSGDRTIENGLMANVFSGNGDGNPSFGDGPASDWPFTSNAPYQYARVASAPVGVTGYVSVT